MFASLPMYARPWNRGAHDAFWALVRDGLRARGVVAPDALDHETGHEEGWARDDLVLGQICNLPLRTRFAGRLTVIGACDHALPETPPGHYRSLWVVRADDPARRVEDCAGYSFAFNEAGSQSGWGSPWADALDRGIALAPVLRTRSHAGSVAAVAAGDADLAAIDLRTWLMDEGHDPGHGALRIIGRTHATPGQTLVTGPGRDPAPFRAAIAGAIANLAPGDRDMLCLRSVVPLPPDAYDLPIPPDPGACVT